MPLFTGPVMSNTRLAAYAAANAQPPPPPNSGGYDPDAQALFDRFSTDPGPSRKQLISDRFVDGKQKSFWAKLDALWVHAAHGPEAGRLNWLADRFNCVPVNNPAFTADRGYMGDGSSSYLDTGFNPAAAGIKSTQNSASVGVRSNTDNQAAGSLAGLFDGAKGTTINPRNAANRMAGRVHQDLGARETGDGTVTSSIGMFVVSRTGPTAHDLGLYRQGAIQNASGSAGNPSQVPVNGTYRLGSISNSSYRACQFSMGFVGAGLSAQEVRDVFDWFEPYRQAVGVN